MSNSIHGHEVLNKLLDETQQYTLERLTAEIEAEFGCDVRFHTCSQQDLTLEQLLNFLLSRQKVVQDGAFLTANPERMCKH